MDQRRIAVGNWPIPPLNGCMSKAPVPLDLSKVKVFPLASRKSMARVEEIMVDPDSAPVPLPDATLRERIERCARDIKSARAKGASVMFLYGAHLVKNGAQKLMDRLLEGGW